MADDAPAALPFESASELREQHGKLLEALDEAMADATESEALRQVEPRIHAFLERATRTGVYLEEVKERTACQALLDYWVSSLAQNGVQAAATRLAPFDDAQLPDLKDKACPYVGLEAFRPSDTEYFFGREADSTAAIEQLARSPLLVVLGASGSGKSSLVMGGVLPALGAAATPPGLRLAAVFVPGNAVLVRLARAVLQVSEVPGDATSLAAELPLRPERLTEAAGDGPVVVTVDQFEEVFTLCDGTARDAAAAALAAMLAGSPKHRVILTMREEFRSRLVELQPLAPYLDKAWYSMRPMGYAELRAAVERPAVMVNLQFQAGIVDDLVKKVLGQPAALPLLQFTLRELWNRRDRNRITWEVYRKVGDPLVALQTSADAFFDGLAPQTQAEVRRILLELVRVDELLEAYRRPVPKSVLLRAGKANTDEVLALLTGNDWLRTTAGDDAGDSIVEVKHEALIRNWPRLVGWIDEKRVERRQRLALTQAAQRWAESSRPAAGLLTGWQLEEAKKLDDLSEIERELVDTSAQELERVQLAREAALKRETVRLWSSVAALGLMLAVTLVALWIAYVKWDAAEELSRSNKSRELSAYAVQQADNDPELGLLLAQEAYGKAGTLHARGALQLGLSRTANALLALRPDGTTPMLSPDGRRLFSTRRSESPPSWTVQATDIDTTLGDPLLGAAVKFKSVAFAPGGRYLYGVPAAAMRPSYEIWDTVDGRRLAGGADAAVELRALRFFAQTAAIAIGGDNKLLLWHPEKPPVELQGGFAGVNTLNLARSTPVITSVQLSSDGGRLVMTGARTGVVVWNAETGARVAAMREEEGKKAVAAADARHVALFDEDAVKVWRLDAGKVTPVAEVGRSVLDLQALDIAAVKFLRVEPLQLLIEAKAENSRGSRLLLWKPTKAAKGDVLELADGVQLHAASPNGRYVAWTGKSAAIFDLATELFTEIHNVGESQSARIQFAAGSRSLALMDDSGRIALLDLPSGRPQSEFIGHRSAVLRIVVSEDGRRLLSVDRDGQARVWSLPPIAPPITLTTPVGKFWDEEAQWAAFTKDRRFLIAGFGAAGVGAFDREKQTWRLGSASPTAEVGRAYFSTDIGHVLTLDSDQRARVWSTADARPLAALSPQQPAEKPTRSRSSRPAFVHGGISDDGKVAWTWESESESDLVTAWSVATGAPVFSLGNEEDENISCVTMSPDARWLATCVDNNKRDDNKRDANKRYVRVYDLSRGRNAAAASEASASRSAGSRVQAAGAEHVDLPLNADDVYFSDDGHYAVVRTQNLTAVVYGTADWQTVSQLVLRATPSVLKFSADGTRLLVVDDGTARTFDLKTGRPLAEVRRERGDVNVADFSPTADSFALGTDSGAVKIFDVHTGRVLATQNRSAQVMAMQFAANSRELTVLRADGTLSTLDCELCSPDVPLSLLAERKLRRLKRTLSEDERRTFID